MSDQPPRTLGHDAIAAWIPHSGAMCLLERLDSWTDTRIVCSAINHRDAANPLRSASGLLACTAIEYAAQAMALHGALTAQAAGMSASPGYLASVRAVRLETWRLDDLAPAEPDELTIEADRQAGDGERIVYAFTLTHGGRAIASGRAAVVLNTPVPES